jgi:Delta6-protoilludene synthase
MALCYVCDEYTDIEDEHGAAKIAAIIMDALRNPSQPRPHRRVRHRRASATVLERASALTSPMARRRHFVDTFQQFTDAVTEQACDRRADRVR